MSLSEGRTDYVLGDGDTLYATPATIKHRAHMRELLQVERLIDAAYCGALIAGAFRRHEWLDRFTLSVSEEYVYDDSGGYFRSVSVGVLDVGCGEVSDRGEDPDELVASELQDESETFGFLLDEAQEREFELRRVDISDLLTQRELSGRDAFKRLFPTAAVGFANIDDRY